MSAVIKASNRYAAQLRWIMPLLSLAIFCGMLALLHHALRGYHIHSISQQVKALPLRAVGLALFFTCASYAVLTGYDALALRFIERNVSRRKRTLTSFIAFAIGHNIGLAALSGGAVRLRLYGASGLGAVDVALITGFCALTTFLGATTLISYAFLVETGQAAALLHLAPEWVRSIGLALAAVLLTYFVIAGVRRRPVTLGNWSVGLPSVRLGFAQLGIAAADFCLAAAVLYCLLPASVSIPYPPFLAIYVLAVVAGIIANVPGGVGVVESVMLLALPGVRPDALLASLLVFRFIYYLLPLIVASLLLAGHEAWLQRHRLRAAAGAARDWLSAIAPQTLGTLVFVAGAVLLVSGATPALTRRLAELDSIVPLPILELSHLLGSVAGLGLVILSRALFRRVRLAWQLSILLLLAGAVFSLLKGFDYEEALITLSVAGLLLLSESAFYRTATLLENSFTPQWLLGLSVLVVTVVWIGFVSHKHVEYSNELWWTFAMSGNAPRMLRASLVVCVLAAGFVALNLLSPSTPEPGPPDLAGLDQIRPILEKTSSAHANVALLGDKRILMHPQGDAFLMYQISGRSWIAMGDPVGDLSRASDLAWSLRELSNRHGGWTVFYEVSPDYLPCYIDLGLALLKLGEEARVELKDFSLQGSHRGELRNACRRAEREGASFEVVAAQDITPLLLAQLKEVSDEWLKGKAASEKRFSVGFFDERYLSNFAIGVIRREGRPVSFANLWMSGNREEISVDLMRHSTAAPKLVMDYLFTQLMLWGKEQGYHWFNLGMAPLSGLEQRPLAPAWHRMGRFVFGIGEHFYNFEGLRKYKEKFQPVWEPRYLAAPGGFALPRVLLDVTALIAGGLREVVSK